MARRGALLIAIWSIWSLGLTTAVGVASEADDAIHYRDEFNAISYSGNDGAQPFTTRWREIGDDGGPVGGTIRVDSSGCSGNCLTIGGDGAYLETIGITRLADAAGAAELRLTYEYRIAGLDPTPTGGVKVMASADGGRTWGLVRYYPIAQSKTEETTVSADISEWASPVLMIGFFGSGTASGYVTFDDIDIKGTLPPPSTTSTSSTTTTTPPTTTSTTATTTTTTTTAPPTVTTVPPPSDTTSTRPPATTTTTAAAVPTTPTTTPGGAEPQDQADLIAATSRYTDKADLMTTNVDTGTIAEQQTPAPLAPSPIEHATTGITIAASTLRTNALAAFALGILIALLALRGLSRLDDKDA